MKNALRWDIFCAVVDNYGDIGVCWRLARQLVSEHGLQVRLWVDDLAPLARLRPGVDVLNEAQPVDGVDVRHWPKTFPAIIATEIADVVIEAFACELPGAYVAAMVQCKQPPVWINLEYLSAEDWVDGAHGLPSPHPRLTSSQSPGRPKIDLAPSGGGLGQRPEPGAPLVKYFFFPGFTAKTGGLIREADYEKRKTAFDASAFRARLGLPPKRNDELTISLFGYENPALPGLLDAWTHSNQPIICIIPEGRLLPDVQTFFGHHDSTMQRGHLTAHVIPFLPQEDYDCLLWLCDLNFVRGEDSFVRAQWAEKPFVWHIYPQADAAHRVKLDAFLDRYLADFPAHAVEASRKFWDAWNEAGDVAIAWPRLAQALPVLQVQARGWKNRIATHGDLASNLLEFVGKLASK